MRITPNVDRKGLIRSGLGLMGKGRPGAMHDAVVQKAIDEAPDLVFLLDHLLRHEKHAGLSVDAELPEHIDSADKGVLLAPL